MIVCGSDDKIEVNGTPAEIISEVATIVCGLIETTHKDLGVSTKIARDFILARLNEAIDYGYHSYLNDLFSNCSN